MSDGISLIDALLAVVISFVIASLVLAIVKVNSEFEIRYDENIEMIESDIEVIYEQARVYLY